MWTRFMDMHSGGGQKEKLSHIYIEAEQKEAEVIFYNRFGHNPNRVSCTCCGQDYSIDENEDLKQATAYERNCDWDSKLKRYIESPQTKYGNGKLISVEEYLKLPNVAVIYSKDIKPEERIGDLPNQGYIWVD